MCCRASQVLTISKVVFRSQVRECFVTQPQSVCDRAMILQVRRVKSVGTPRLPSCTPKPRSLATEAYLSSSRSRQAAAGLSRRDKKALDSALRVDHAGEVAANWIYKGQLAVLGQDPKVAPVIEVRTNSSVTTFLSEPVLYMLWFQEMWDQEKKHLKVMDRLIAQHHVRPTMLLEVAKVAGYGLGVATALMGRNAAMTCTEAVETVIGEHYDE